MSQALKSLLEQAERERDAARAALAQAETVAQRLAQQSDQLLAYRADTHARGPTAAGRSAAIELVHHQHGFVQRLDQALDQVQGQQQHARARNEQLRQRLLALELRLASVRKLVERREMAMRIASARQEQRGADDVVMQRLWRLGADAMPLST